MRRPVFAAAGENRQRNSDDDEEDLLLAASRRHVIAAASAPLRHHQSHLSFDTSAAVATTLAPYHWPMLPPASPSPAIADMPQVVLQNSSAMVVWDPPAHELVVYKHSTSPLLTGAAGSSPPQHARGAAAAATVAGLPSAGHAHSSIMPGFTRYHSGGGNNGSSGGGNLQPFNHSLPYGMQRMRSDDDEELMESNVCRLCRRPFWSPYAHDGDDEFDFDAEMAAGVGNSGVGGSRHARPFTSRDYFKLLHSTEEAAQANRQYRRDSMDGSNSRRRSRRGRATIVRGQEAHAHRPPQRSPAVEIEEVSEFEPLGGGAAQQGMRTRRSAAATTTAAAVVSSPPDTGPPVVRTRSGRASRSGVGIRREPTPLSSSGSGGGLAESGSVVGLTGVLRSAQPAVSELDDDGNSVAVDDDAADDASYDASSMGAADEDDDASEVAAEEDEVLDCGLHRSSFNSGYYARFFREECKLGAGGAGGVWLTHHVLDSVPLGTYAVKKIPVGRSRPWLLQVLKEVRALEGLHHRHIIAYKHSWLEEGFKPTDFGPTVPCLFLLMEYANRGTLADLIWPKVPPPGVTGAAAARSRAAAAAAAAAGTAATPPVAAHIMPEEDVWSIFIGVCTGLRHLHRAGVIHRDLKPQNLLLTEEVDALGRPHGLRVLVSDFGTAILKGMPYAHTGNTGTLSYTAPETLVQATQQASTTTADPMGPMSVESDESIDRWSLGCILYAMAFGTLPFLANSPDALFAEIRSKLVGGSRGSEAHPLALPSHPARSPEMCLIIQQLLSFDPVLRPSLDELLQRPELAQRRQRQHQQRSDLQRYNRRPALYQERSSNAYHSSAGGANDQSGAAGASGGGRSGHDRDASRSHALVISPTLPSHSRTSRSVSPAPPLSLNAPSVSPSGSPGDSPTMHALGGDRASAAPKASGTTSAAAAAAAATLQASGRSASTALVLMSQVSVLPRPLRLALSALTTLHHGVLKLLGKTDDDACWRCSWTSSNESAVHLVVLVVKLWMSLNLLVSAPSSRSMYLGVFPQMLLSLLLLCSVPLPSSHPSAAAGWLQQLASHVPVVAGGRHLRHACRWLATASPIEWGLLRGAAALLAAACLAIWLLVLSSVSAVDSSASSLPLLLPYHLLNVALALLQCLALLASTLALHPSHLSLPGHQGLFALPPHRRRESSAGSSFSAAAAGERDPATATPRHIKLTRALSPLVPLNGAGGAGGGGGGGGGAASGPRADGHDRARVAPLLVANNASARPPGAVLTRLPLLLPPMPTPVGTPVALAATPGAVAAYPATTPTVAEATPRSSGPHIVRRPLLMR